MIGTNNDLPTDSSNPVGSKRKLGDDRRRGDDQEEEGNANDSTSMASDNVPLRRQSCSVPTVLTPAARRAIYQLPCNDWLLEPVRREFFEAKTEVWQTRSNLCQANESFCEALDRQDSLQREAEEAAQRKLILDNIVEEHEESADDGSRRAQKTGRAAARAECSLTRAIVSFAEQFVANLPCGTPASVEKNDTESPPPAIAFSRPEQQGEPQKKRRKKTLPGKSESSVILAMRLEKVVALEAARSRAVDAERQAQANLARAVADVLESRVTRREAIDEVANLELQEVRHADEEANSQARTLQRRMDWDIARTRLNKVRDEYHALTGVMLR